MANKVQMLPDNWTYEEYYNFVQNYNAGNLTVVYELVKKLILSWDYPIDLKGEDPIGELKMKDSFELLRTVFTTVGKFIEDMDTSDIKFDGDVWNNREMLEFNKYKTEGNHRKAEAMLRQVIKWDVLKDLPVDELLPFPVAARCYQVVNEEIRRIASGKN